MDAVDDALLCPRCRTPGEPHCARAACDWLKCLRCPRSPSDPAAWYLVWSPDTGSQIVLPVVS